jgi:hypothetical protein
MAGTPVQTALVEDALAYFRVLHAGRLVGAGWRADDRFGSEAEATLPASDRARRDRVLSRYTEPEAGSDLGAARRAPRVTATIRHRGHKLIQHARALRAVPLADRATDASGGRREGYSFFVVDSNAAGIVVQPLLGLSNKRTNAVFYDNVRVPAENLVGEEGRGWECMTSAALAFGGCFRWATSASSTSWSASCSSGPLSTPAPAAGGDRRAAAHRAAAFVAHHVDAIARRRAGYEADTLTSSTASGSSRRRAGAPRPGALRANAARMDGRFGTLPRYAVRIRGRNVELMPNRSRRAASAPRDKFDVTATGRVAEAAGGRRRRTLRNSALADRLAVAWRPLFLACALAHDRFGGVRRLILIRRARSGAVSRTRFDPGRGQRKRPTASLPPAGCACGRTSLRSARRCRGSAGLRP